MNEWEERGLSYANNSFGVGFDVNDENYDAAGAVLKNACTKAVSLIVSIVSIHIWRW